MRRARRKTASTFYGGHQTQSEKSDRLPHIIYTRKFRSLLRECTRQSSTGMTIHLRTYVIAGHVLQGIEQSAASER
ncbi:unnamed protein product [Acanthoscelides obtectus]|uniref:Uncharacterized protein n=1 Tax=Acanthoscelides obtectus TaxID=200917 RepID=A0A9P0NW85_ACAOB|nr:unnamed protein product [Acanthoscelides obtectus]CAK1662084.1 hypothetical protein AOBTE_LOCUS22973 [Acanthoscelides obtectus]